MPNDEKKKPNRLTNLLPKNKNSKNTTDFRNEINKENQLINSALFGGFERSIDQSTDTVLDSTRSFERKLQDLNEKYKDTTGSNPMEFFNRLELSRNDSDDKRNDGKNGENKKIKKLESLIKNSNGEFFLEEKDRFFRYEDYRLIDSYITEVSKCLDLYRDCIMSPDDITKKSLTFFYDDKSIDDEKHTDLKTIQDNIKELDKLYKLNQKIPEDLREACQLGDLFYLLMPYDVGFNKVLNEDDMFVRESYSNHDEYGEFLTESMMSFDDDEDFIELFSEERRFLSDKSNKAKEGLQTIERAKKEIIDSLNNNIKYFKDPTDILSERKINENKGSKDLKAANITGSIFKKIAPENIVALDIDGQVLGYIYIEKNNINMSQKREGQRNANPNSLRSGNTGSSINTSDSLGYGSNDVFNSRYDYLNRDQSMIKSKYSLITQIFVKGISKKINKDFLKNNLEFKELIYNLVHQEYIIKKEVKMTFIEPEYIFHLKMNSSGVYGVSKISKSLFFSKIYLAVLLTNLMQKIIRGRDKRAFYIDTGLDDDIEDTVQGFIRDIKSKELTSGHLKNITSILNSVGAFEDYYIPTIDGQRSIEIDTVQGMDIEINNEFLQFLTKGIIMGMGVPSTYVDASSEIDYARSLTMSNNPFVRTIVKDQAITGEFFTDVIRALYRNEFLPNYYDELEKKKKRRSTTKKTTNKKYKISFDLDLLELRFPTPIYLVLNNTNEQINNSQTVIEYLTSLYFPDDPTGQLNTLEREEKKANFRRSLAKECFLQTMDWKKYDSIYEKVIMESIEDTLQKNINFNQQAKKEDELDSLEEEDFDDE